MKFFRPKVFIWSAKVSFQYFIQNVSQALSKCLSKWIKVDKWDYLKNTVRSLWNFASFFLIKAILFIVASNHRMIANDSWFWIDMLMTWVRLMEFSFPLSLMNTACCFLYWKLLKEFLRIITWVQICTLGDSGDF